MNAASAIQKAQQSASEKENTSEKASVRDTLNDVAHGLLMMSESDRPIKAFSWSGKKTGDASCAHDALLNALQPKDPTLVKTITVEEFFAPMTQPKDWWGDDEKETCAKFTALVQAIRENLTNPEAFRIEGDPEIPVYIVGRDSSGTWSGIKTVVVET